MHKKKLSCLVLCGGKGSRLGKLGEKIPKTLLKLQNKSIIDYLIINLNKNGIEKILLSTFYKHHLIKKHINKEHKGKNIRIYNDGDIQILQRIKLALKRCEGDLLVCYGDEIANINIKKLYKNHLKSNKELTIVTFQLKSNFGFLFKKKKKFFFKEKPIIGNYNIGYMIFNLNSIKYIRNIKSLENYINKLCDLNKINEYIHKGKHTTVNTIEDYDRAKRINL
ncbi:sugar phosphate nucleotidyltransferase [Alphaproteobacteria bacterium]|nr:sugar phosphate nucleotidyltransferase [Alphaproteobacteria bacterium]